MLIKAIESLELQFAEINAQYSLKIQESHQQPRSSKLAIQEPSIQNPENPVMPDETIETAAENNPISFIIGIAGILLTVLIAIIIMWSYRKIQRSFRNPLMRRMNYLCRLILLIITMRLFQIKIIKT